MKKKAQAAQRASAERGENIWFEAAMLEEQGDIRGAVKLYSKAARLGDLGSMLNLANLLDDYVSPPKPALAVYWYKRAARRGYATAAINLAVHYQNLRKRRWYIHWLKVAAELGDRDAIKDLRREVRRK